MNRLCSINHFCLLSVCHLAYNLLDRIALLDDDKSLAIIGSASADVVSLGRSVVVGLYTVDACKNFRVGGHNNSTRHL